MIEKATSSGVATGQNWPCDNDDDDNDDDDVNK